MSDFLAHVAGAALPVAFVLVIVAASARAVLWVPLDDERAQRIARHYLEPLSTWCLVAVATYAVATLAAGGAGLPQLGLTLVLGAAALLVRSVGEETKPPAPPPVTPPPPPAAPAAEAPAPAMSGSLWANPVEDSSTQRHGLWSR